MIYKQLSLCVVIPLLSLVIAGCGGSDRPDLASASGIVTLDGDPVEGASVSYIPVSGGRPGSGVTDASGRYTINTYADTPGALVGEHHVSVIKVSGPGADQLLGDEPTEAPDDCCDCCPCAGLSELEVDDSNCCEDLDIVYDVPQKYMDPRNSGLQVTVPPDGSDALNLELTE